VDDLPSLYPIDGEALQKAEPTLIITQDLCQVCAPSSRSVARIYEGSPSKVEVLSLSPNSLEDVLENIQLVASTVGVAEVGKQLVDEIRRQLKELHDTILEHRDARKPRMFLFEWLSPPFDAGHWMPDMMQWACVDHACSRKADRKSKELTWQEVADTKPTTLLVACCGFDLERNYQDALSVTSDLASLGVSAAFATNGDQFFARPGPKLLTGAVLMALCGYWDQPKVLDAIRSRPFGLAATQYKRIPLDTAVKRRKLESESVPDIEDFYKLHQEACARGDTFYTDPASGFLVFTEVAHRKRGKCCGSGCRHCPYNHANVREEQKLVRIQQPAILARGTNPKFAPDAAPDLRVVFFSGGKDSFLTVRTLASAGPMGLVLLTTFDAPSRVIAHQDISIEIAQRQAKHLGLTLLGVPMHRGSRESYISRIGRALDLLQTEFGKKVKSLVFGDLHLDHIRSWRETELSKLGFQLEFPLWHMDYHRLEEDLTASGIHVVVSSSTIEHVKIGEVYDQSLRDKLRQMKVDVFGEGGEFHTVAEVWSVDPERALGGAVR